MVTAWDESGPRYVLRGEYIQRLCRYQEIRRKTRTGAGTCHYRLRRWSRCRYGGILPESTGWFLPAIKKYEKPNHVAQPIQTVGRGKAVPEMLCEEVEVVDPELVPSELTPPEEPGPSPAPSPVGRTEECEERGYKVGKRLQSTIRPVLEPPSPELQPETSTQVPKNAAKAASEELWAYKIPMRKRRTPTPSSSSNSDQSTSDESRESRSLSQRRERAESLESAMPKLTREPTAVVGTDERPSRGERGALSRIKRSKKHAKVRKRVKRSKGDHGGEDIKDVLRQLTEELRRGGGGRSEELVGRRRVPVQSESRRRDPQWSRSGWRAGVGVHGGARRGVRR